MEENNDTLLAGGDALMYLTEPTHKKYSTKMFWAIHLVRTYLMTDFSIPLLLHFLASHSVSSSLPQKTFLSMVASNCQLFYYVFMTADKAYLCKWKGELL